MKLLNHSFYRIYTGLYLFHVNENVKNEKFQNVKKHGYIPAFYQLI